MEGELHIILWINIVLSYVCVLYFVILKTVLCLIVNRIKCHTKIHTEPVLLFSFIVLDSIQNYFLSL